MFHVEHRHEWKETGRRDVYIDFPTKTGGRRACTAVYVRCEICSRPGFRRPWSAVVYICEEMIL